MNENDRDDLKTESEPCNQIAEPSGTPPETDTEAPPPPSEENPIKISFFKKAQQRIGPFVRSTGAWLQRTTLAGFHAARRFNPLACVACLDQMMATVRTWFPGEATASFFKGTARLGHIGLALAQILTPILFLAAAIRLSSGALFLQGLGWTFLLMALHYSAARFLDTDDNPVQAGPMAPVRPALLNSVALLTEALAIMAFFAIVITAGRLQDWTMAWIGVAILILGDALFLLLLHPSLLNVRLQNAPAPHEEAKGMLTLFVNMTVRLVPIAFGIGTLTGVVGIASGLVSVLFSSAETWARQSMLPGFAPVKMTAFCAALPLAAYILHTFHNLLARHIGTLKHHQDTENSV